MYVKSGLALAHKIPLAGFFITVTVALAVGLVSYFESIKLIKEQEYDKLKIESQIVTPILSDFYKQSALDASFLGNLPAVQKAIESGKSNQQSAFSIWQERLNVTFLELMKTKSSYRKISLVLFNDDFGTVASVVRQEQRLISINPNVLSSIKDVDEFGKVHLSKSSSAYFSSLYQVLEETDKFKNVLSVAAPVYEYPYKKQVGNIVIELDFDSFINELKSSSLKDIPFFIANSDGQVIYEPFGDSKAKNTENIRDIFAGLDSVLLGEKNNMRLGEVQHKGKQYTLGYFFKVQAEGYPSVEPIFVLFEIGSEQYILAAQAIRSRAILLGVVLALLCLGLSYVAARKLTKPLAKLAKELKRFEESGEINSLPTKSTDEIGVLARGFEQLLSRIQEKSLQQYQAISKAQIANSKLEAVLNSIADAVINVDREGNILSFNLAAEKIFGYIEDEVIGRNVSLLLPMEYDQEHGSDSQPFLTKDSTKVASIGREMPGLRKDGERFSMHLSVSQVETEDGIVYTGLIRDITANKLLDAERKRVLNGAKEAAWRLDFALSAPGIGVWDYDLNIKTAQWDSRMYSLFGTDEKSGLSPDEIWNKCIHPDDKVKVNLLLRQCQYDGNDLNFQYRIITQNKNVKIIETHAKVMYDEYGRRQRIVGTNQDVTEQTSIQKLKEEALEMAEESLRLKSEFLASMSHEIRTPMNGVLGMLNLLEQSSLSKQQKKHLKLATSSAQSLLTLINDILDFSKIEAGKLDLEILDFDIVSQFGEFAESMAIKAQEKNVELILDLTGVSNTMVKGDPSRIRQILTNLVGNAVKFTEQGEIVIKALLKEIGERYILNVSVSDTGIGIPKDKVNDLFESFTQVDASTTRKYGGTGLGLAIVKQLCELMGGRVSVVSEVGRGSRFTFEVELQKSHQKALIMPDNDIRGLKILVVDDNETNLAVLTGQLNIWGAKVTEARDGFDALNIIQSHEANYFDVAILDMQMPGMDGATLGKSIKDHEHSKLVKMIMMTSMSERGDARFFSELGFSAYFPKPATNSDLFDALSIVVDEESDFTHGIVTSHLLRSAKKEAENSSIEDSTRILLVEDNRINQAVIIGILKNFGLSCDVANNGVEALQMLENSPQDLPYNILIMDCQMPEMDGYQTTKEIRKGSVGARYVKVPIVAMTANAMKGDKEKCLAVGMNDYTSKPVSAKTIYEKLVTWLPEHLVISDEFAVEKSHSDTHEEELSEDLVWDKQGFLNRIRNNQEIANKLIQLFKDDMPKLIVQLDFALTENEVENIKSLAHKLKGSARNIGANRLGAVAEQIENSLNKSEKQDSSVVDFDLNNELDVVLQAFEQLGLKTTEVQTNHEG